MNDDILICPGCKKPLEVDGSFTYDDCCGSEWSRKHVCVNDDCHLAHKAFWCDHGDYFSGDMKFGDFRKLYGHDKSAAFNSISKRTEIEIYKRDLKSKTYLSPIFTLWWLKPYIEHNYVGNEMGEILKKTYKLKFLKKSNGSYNVHYSSDIYSFYRSIKSFKRCIKYYKKQNSRFSIEQIMDKLSIASWDKRWYRHLSLKWNKFRYKKIINEITDKDIFFKLLDENNTLTINEDRYNLFVKVCPSDIDLLKELVKDHSDDEYIKKLIRKRKFETIL